MEYFSVREAAAAWGIDPSGIGRLARQGRIPGAKLVGRSWLIPQSAKKPADGRTRPVKAAKRQRQGYFRFPLYVNAPPESFSPPLTGEEALLRAAQLNYYACNFDAARGQLEQLLKLCQTPAVRVICLFYLCSLAVEVYEGEGYLYYAELLRQQLREDFAGKKELQLVLPWLSTVLTQLQAVSGSLQFDPQYDYSPEAEAMLGYLSVFHLMTDCSPKGTGVHLDAYELLCRSLTRDGRYYQACELHFLLFLTYHTRMAQQQMLYHLQQGLSLALAHELPLVPACYAAYYPDIFELALSSFAPEFACRVRQAGRIICKSTGVFTEQNRITRVYSALSGSDYTYLVYATQRYSNQAVARALGLSQRTVAAHYSALYQKLGVETKQQLIELFANSLKGTSIN